MDDRKRAELRDSAFVQGAPGAGFRYDRYRVAQEFLDTAGERLMEQEAVNNLMLGISGHVAGGGSYGEQSPYFGTVSRNVALELAAVMTPPHNLVLARLGTLASDAARTLARCLHRDNVQLPGTLAPVDLAAAFAEQWRTLTGAAVHTRMSLRTHELRVVCRVPLAPGLFRKAELADHDLLSEWVAGFNTAVHGNGDMALARKQTAERTSAGELYVWEHGGRPVSLAGRGRESRNGAAVMMVFTPEHLRGQGYATSCVAHLSQAILDSGKRFAMLFTDMANPVSNHVYRKIGYEPLEDFAEVAFEQLATA